MNVLSLFDGMSCGQLALQRAGIKYDNYYASEVDKWAIKVTQANFPNTKQLGDVRRIKRAKNIDLLIGGSPCQGFSFAGKQLNFNDPRSALFFEFVRLLKECKPKYFLLENVKMKKEFQDVISEQLGVQPIEINSALVSAQNRKRLYWTNIPNIVQPEERGVTINSVLECENNCNQVSATIGYSKDRVFRITEKFGCLTATMYKGVRAAGRPIVASESIIGEHIDSVDKNMYRMLTPIECERLQTVPVNYTNHVSNTQRYKMLGNGWTVDVIAHIFKNMEF